MRSLRIIGIFLSTVAVFLALNWFLNTLMPLNQLNSLQPSRAEVLNEDTLSSTALLECHVSRNWTTSSPALLLNCNGSEVGVQQEPKNIKNLSSKIVAPGQKKAIAVSDPVVMIGKMASGRNSNVIEADLLAYGNRSSNLSALQTNGVLQIISAEVTGLLGILLLFIDWRLLRARRARIAGEVLQAEKAYASSGQKTREQPPYQHKY
ncbi:MAG: hypothetical protein KME11_18145 [Timaviella obliquedivisa GSE-PSE-MK23-08B]|nr:hypothetical protein [Timaviella obliquedivisa GSE-PSE-MK23-08B]